MVQTLPALPARLIHADADGFLAKCVAQLNGASLSAGAGVSIDASALTDFDSSVLALLLGVRRAVVSRGGVLEVECRELLQAFFRAKRRDPDAPPSS